MTMDGSEATYDLVLTGARICDPAAGLDRNCDLAVNGDRIAAVGSGLTSHTTQVIELDGKLVTAGWVDLHVHVFEWMTTFGLLPDDAGVHSGVTTAVDQGGRRRSIHDPGLQALHRRPRADRRSLLPVDQFCWDPA